MKLKAGISYNFSDYSFSEIDFVLVMSEKIEERKVFKQDKGV